jgi:hypothetical protein
MNDTCNKKIRGAEHCALLRGHKGNHRSLAAIKRRNAVRREERKAERAA